MIDFQVGTPNAHGFINVQVVDEGATDLQAFADAIAERYPTIHQWRHRPSADSAQDWITPETRHWCVARFVVREQR